MKKEYSVEVGLSGDLMKKLLYISEKEGRSPENQFVFMLRNNISYYERAKGGIPTKALAEVDASSYRVENAEK